MDDNLPYRYKYSCSANCGAEFVARYPSIKKCRVCNAPVTYIDISEGKASTKPLLIPETVDNNSPDGAVHKSYQCVYCGDKFDSES